MENPTPFQPAHERDYPPKGKGVERSTQTLLPESALFEHLDELLGEMRQGLLYLSQDGIISTYNAAAEILLGIEEKEVVGLPYSSHFPHQFFGFSIRHALKTGQAPGQVTVHLTSNHGLERVVEVCPTPLKRDGKPIGLLLLLLDITEFQRLQDDRLRSSRLEAIGTAASSVAHEIKNPIGAIQGFAELLAEKLKSDPQSLKYLSRIIEGTEDLKNIVTQILDFSRPLEPHLSTVDLVPYLTEFTEKAKAAGPIEFQTDLDSASAQIDRRLFDQLLWNLTQNAFEALPQEKGVVLLTLKREGPATVISLKDNGKGISKEGLKRLFEPFYTTKPGGNGFGLPRVQKVVYAHGGALKIDSSIEKGANFIITLYR